jgi:hypothetical protein
MTTAQRQAHLFAHGWEWVGAGYVPPIADNDRFADGAGFRMQSGLYSLSTAIRECLARENPQATPNEDGRYYHGQQPTDLDPGQPW